MLEAWASYEDISKAIIFHIRFIRVDGVAARIFNVAHRSLRSQHSQNHKVIL